MAIDFSKYINSTGTHYISNSGSDEKKGYSGGQAGDQTGKEWELKAWYNRPWTVVLRYPDSSVGLKIAELGISAALNNKIGYDQYQRKTYWSQLEKANYDPSKITTACEEDCTAGVTANCKAVGYLMNIQPLKDLDINIYSGNMKSCFTKAGFKALTDSKYLTGHSYLMPGDILLCENHHAATNITYGKNVEKVPTIKPVEPNERINIGDRVVVSNGNYYIRTQPSAKSKDITIAFKGSELPYLGETENGWYKVSYKGGTGWISSKCGGIVKTEVVNEQRLIVKSGKWNVRKGPAVVYKSLGVVHGGDELVYLGKKKNGWLEIDYNGKQAWISEKGIVK